MPWPFASSGATTQAHFLQNSYVECGLACVGYVSAQHGLLFSMRELRRRFPVSLHGTTMRRLLQMAEQLNMSARGVQLEMGEIGALRLPAILHWDMNHFVVLLQRRRHHVVVFDPALGRRKLALTELSKHFSGVAMELWPGLNFRRERRLAPMHLGALLGVISGLMPALLGTLLLSLALSAAGLLAPLQIQLLIDQALPQSDLDLVLLIIIGFAFLQVFAVCCTVVRRFLSLRVAQAVALGMQGNLVRHLMALPLRYFQSRHIGDILNKIESANSVQAFLLSGTVSAIVDGLVAAAALALLFTYGTALALLCCLAILTTQCVDLAVMGWRRQLAHEQQLASGREHTLIVEMLSGIQALKLSGGGGERVTVWEAAFSHVLARRAQRAGVDIVAEAGQAAMATFFNAIILYLLAQSVLRQDITVGMMMSFLAYRSFLDGGLSGLAQALISYRMLSIPLERLADIVMTPAETLHIGDVRPGESSIEFRDVWFRYDETLPFVLRGASFRVEAGEHVAIAGTSGSGKSTIFKLLLRIEEPERGEILVGGRPIRSLNLQAYRDALGVVMQDDQLFTGSLAENITMFSDAVDEEQLWACCHLAGIASDIATMPMGLMTMVGDMGSALSGGQRQRLMLARALYRRPRLLLLDEATSHLDPGLERGIGENLRGLRCTRLSIAHRQETLDTADRVLPVERGTVQPKREKNTKSG